MPSKPCLTCGALSDGSYCPAHRPARTGRPRPFKNGWQATRWRNAVMAQTNGRCAVEGCATPTDRVEAHHVQPISDGGDPLGWGVPLCAAHHRQVTNARRLKGAA